MSGVWEWLRNNAFVLTPIVLVFSTLVAWTSALIAWRALGTVQKNQRETIARNIWNDFLKLAIANPVLAYPPKFSNRFNYEELRITMNKKDASQEDEREEFEKYEWFMAILFITAREVFRLKPVDRYLAIALERNIRYHSKFVVWRHNVWASQDANKERAQIDFIRGNGPEVERIIRQILAEHRA